MLGNLTGWHLLIILAVILLLFGAAKLPALAKSLGQSARVFRGEIKEMRREDAAESDASRTDSPEARSASNAAAEGPGASGEPKP